jgi:hypothetical protein
MVDRRVNERGGQTSLMQRLQGIEEWVETGLKGLDDATILVFRALQDQPPGIGGEKIIVVVEVDPLRVPLGMVGCQPDRDVLSRLLRLPHLLHQVKAAGPHRLPHPCGPTRNVEELAPVEVEP